MLGAGSRRHQPRKTPVQDRSRASFEAILEAGLLLLGQHDTWRISTNRVADRAGVSVGSLYQYFPSREAIVATLIERSLLALQETLGEHIRRGAENPPELLEAAVQALAEERRRWHPAAPLLTRAITWVGLEAPLVQVAESVRAPLVDTLKPFRAELWSEDVDHLTFSPAHMVHSAFRAMEQLEPAWLFDAAFAREVTALLVRALMRRPPPLRRLSPPPAGTNAGEPVLEPPPQWNRPQQDKARARVRAILKATTGLVGSVELEELSMSSVARTSKIGAGTLYRYFPSRESLVAALIERRWDAAFAAAEAELAAPGPFGDRVDAMVAGLVTSLREDPVAGPRLTAACSWVGMEGAIVVRARRLEVRLANAIRALPELRRAREPARAAFALVHGLHGTLRAMELLRPELLTCERYLDALRATARRFLAEPKAETSSEGAESDAPSPRNSS